MLWMMSNASEAWSKFFNIHRTTFDSSVDSSAPTILQLRVRVPSIPSMLTIYSQICAIFCHVKRTKINKRRPGLAHFYIKHFPTQSNLGLFKTTQREEIFLNGPIPASFCLFSFFSHPNSNDKYIIWKKHRWYAWDSNPGWLDGRRRRIHWAMAAPIRKKNVWIAMLYGHYSNRGSWGLEANALAAVIKMKFPGLFFFIFVFATVKSKYVY